MIERQAKNLRARFHVIVSSPDWEEGALTDSTLENVVFAPLPVLQGGFQCVVADVPSRFRSNSEAKPGRNAMRHYTCHSMATIATLPVRDVVARDAFLFFWTTDL